ncbi:MAG TPA: helix-turn-helix domain-containing protein [Candidatus Dormibacteraeota bacterium]
MPIFEPQASPPPLITFKALRQVLGVSSMTAATMLAAGRLPGYHVQGQWRFNLEEVLAALRAEPGQRVQPRQGGVRGPYKTRRSAKGRVPA